MALTGGAVRSLGRGGGITTGFRVIGIPEAIAKFRGVDQVVRLQLGGLMADIALNTANQAREYCPVITGNLKSSIKAEKAGPYTWDVSASSMDGTDPGGEGKNTEEYAGFVEFGTSKMEARAFMQKAAADVGPLAAAGVAAIAARIQLL